MRIKVADKEVFWNTLELYNGYKLQHNTVFGQFRVVSPDKYREAWSFNKEETYEDFVRISGKANAQLAQSVASQAQVQDTTDYVAKLRDVTELYKDGVITKDEYEALRQEYLAKLK